MPVENTKPGVCPILYEERTSPGLKNLEAFFHMPLAPAVSYQSLLRGIETICECQILRSFVMIDLGM